MKFTLTILEASAADIATIMQAINGGSVQVSPPAIQTIQPINHMPTPYQPPMQPAPLQPSNPAPMPAGDADDNGPPMTSATHDKTGLPWDERIHSSNKAQNADGSWRKRRGVADAIYQAIETEIRGMMQRQPAPMPAMQPAPVQMPAPVQQPQYMPQPVMQPVQQPMPAPVQMPPAMPMQQPAPVQQPQPPAPAPGPAGPDFHTFMQALSGVMQQGKIDPTYLANATAEIGNAHGIALTAITDIANYPQMIPYAIQVFMRDGRWQ